jgi:cysteine desulfurase
VIYLDANATEPPRPDSCAAFLAAFAHANPASVHRPGRAARRLLEDSRETIAGLFGAAPESVIFTSGGTEANALALQGLGQGRRLLVGATEHQAVLASAGPDATLVPVLPDGTVDLDALARVLADAGPALVCLMAANNETGVLHPIDAAASLCLQHGARLHVDAVQAAGRVPLSLGIPGVTSLALSAHKLGGLPGAGALLLAHDVELDAVLFSGGGQEQGRRGGTPALPCIAAFAAAAAAPRPTGLADLRDRIERAAVQAGAVAVGAEAPRLPNTTCLALPGRAAAGQLIALDLAGFAVSAGAACSSGKVAASHVLTAMGLGPLASQAIRVSLPWNAAEADADAFLAAYRVLARGTPAT